MLCEVLFFLLYFRASDVYFSNQFTFRSFHCSSLALLSIKNTIYYGSSIIDPYHSLQRLYLHSNRNQTDDDILTFNIYRDHENFYLKIIPIYFMVYIVYDLKHCFKRIDLLIHHIVCLTWSYINLTFFLGLISLNILCEGITFAYTLNTLKNQSIYRLIFTSLVRFPVWFLTFFTAINIYSSYNETGKSIILFNYIVSCIMILMDCIWFAQNVKKLKQIYKSECDNNIKIKE